MRRYLVCAVLGLSAGCADSAAPPTTAAPDSGPASSASDSTANAVALVTFSCPDMH